MKYNRVGNSGLKVSEIAYGSWLTFGNQVELAEAQEVIQRALDLGINYIDTADVYNNGEAERLLGEVLPQQYRGDYIVATKAFWPMSDAVTNRGLSRKHIVDSVYLSLERLKLKYVDLFYCHRFDPQTPMEETIWAIHNFICSGKIIYWGTSEWSADQIREAHAICDRRGWHKPIINQPNYSLLQRNIEKDILPTCRELGMGTANFSPLAHGILTGKYSGGKIPEGSRGANQKQNMWMKDNLENKEILNQVDKMQPIADKYGITIAQLSLAWLLHQKGISSVITGASRVSQIEDNVQASGISLTAEDFNAIADLFPIHD